MDFGDFGHCSVCMRRCQLAPDEIGYCEVYFCSDWGGERKLIPLRENWVSTLAVEPIEKRPFFHFCAGTKFLSVGLMGCSFSCDFCQNHKVSQEMQANCKEMTPDMIATLADLHQVRGIAFTYSEPTIHPKYLIEVAQRSTLPVVVKTNGYSTPELMDTLAQLIQAWNVDIKGDEAFYERMGVSQKPVWDNMATILRHNQHLEISYLVTPDVIEDWQSHQKFAENVRALEQGFQRPVPVHLLYCYPVFRQTLSYKPERLLNLLGFLRQTLRFVYISNHFGTQFVGFRNTLCPTCGEILVEREKEVVIKKQECCGIPLYNTQNV